jgi:hypothetical protein
MAGNIPRGIRKRLNAAGEPRYQVRYLLRDPDALSGWVETSATFPTVREAKAFKSERDNEAALGARRFDPRLGGTPLSRVSTQFSDSKRPAVSPKTWSGYTQHWELRIAPRFGHMPVDEITRADVQAFVDGLTVGPWRRCPRCVSCGRFSTSHTKTVASTAIRPSASQRAALPSGSVTAT